jgi:hypothetical protein
MHAPTLIRATAFVCLYGSAVAGFSADAPITVQIARDGKANFPIVVSAQASERVRSAAETLADHLERISGAAFEVHTGGGATGIVVGVATEFPDSGEARRWQEPDALGGEEYLLRSHPQGVYVWGATDVAVAHAVWDLLHRIGYRQFFPGKNWEIVPTIRELSVAVDAAEAPDYLSRRIWYGFGAWDYAADPYRRWCAKNRAISGFDLQTGHAYGGIIRAHREQFEQHPEYFALVAGKRESRGESTKLCIGNPGLRKLVVQHALRYFEEHPQAESISMDPSDGGGWCECKACSDLGSVSDRAVILANEVATAINVNDEGRIVGMYAYAYHSPPPTIRVHPRVVISVATAFIKGGFTLDELIDGWSVQGATLGIREYYSVHTWDRDLPGKARGSDLNYLAKTIPEFHAEGARFMSAESSDNWGPNGLGYYVASRILWDVDQAPRVPEIVDDFLTRSFGPAKAPMAEFYRLVDGSREHLILADQIGRMYLCLAEAGRLADGHDVRSRVNDLVLYTRYVELYKRYTDADGEARQAAFEAMIRHAYRIRQTMMVHSKAIYRDVAARDKRVTVPADCGWTVPEERNPWKDSTPFSESEISRYVSEGIDRHPVVDPGFAPVEYSRDLVPARPLHLPVVTPGRTGAGRGAQEFYTFVENAPATIELRITGGLIRHYRDRGNVRVDLWKVGGAHASDQGDKRVAHDRSVPPDGIERAVRLTAREPGLYRIIVTDGNDMTRVDWNSGTRMTVPSSVDEPFKTAGRWSLYFYVPRGTKVVGFFGGPQGDILNAAGENVYSLRGRKPGYHAVPVAPGQDGRLWKIHNAAGSVRLMTVPPYLVRTAQELLLPKEVVERDGD